MRWLWKLIWRMKSDEQILTAKEDAKFWMKTYIGEVSTVKDNVIYRWNTFIKPEMKRRGLKGEIEL